MKLLALGISLWCPLSYCLIASITVPPPLPIKKEEYSTFNNLPFWAVWKSLIFFTSVEGFYAYPSQTRTNIWLTSVFSCIIYNANLKAGAKVVPPPPKTIEFISAFLGYLYLNWRFAEELNLKIETYWFFNLLVLEIVAIFCFIALINVFQQSPYIEYD